MEYYNYLDYIVTEYGRCPSCEDDDVELAGTTDDGRVLCGECYDEYLDYQREAVYDNYDDPMYEDMYYAQRFADPGGGSALWAADADNPRNLPCPTCGEPDRLTPRDVRAGYQCDSCADRAERGYD